MKKTELHTNKRALRVILAAAAVLLLCGAFCGAAAADPVSFDPGLLHYYASAEELVGALNDAEPETAALVKTSVDKDTVKLLKDVNITVNHIYLNTFGDDIYLDLNGHVLSSNANESVIEIYGTTHLILKDSSPNTPHRFTADASGLWVLDPAGDKTVRGGVITGGIGGEGGGILIVNDKSRLTMNGGNIVGNKSTYSGDYAGGGGGVSSYDYGSALPEGQYTFTMNGGTIQGNVAVKNGGGVHIKKSSSSMLMTGGLIANNTAVSGGGIFTYGDLTLTNAKITGNQANGNGDNGAGGGIFCWGAIVTIGDGVEITENYAKGNGGGGIDIEGSGALLNMTGGKIANNVAEVLHDTRFAGMGGGISVTWGAYAEISGGVITGNKALGSSESGENVVASGGGIAVTRESMIDISGNTEISHNEADSTGGGGLFLYDSLGLMNGGTIAYNTVDNGNGGGIDLLYGSDFAMSGGSVHDNVAGNSGGGIGVIVSTLTVDGTAEILDNTAEGSVETTGVGGGILAFGDYVYTDTPSTVTLSGNAKITGNTAKGPGGAGVDCGGAGVWIEYSNFYVNGSPVVMDNTKNGAADNVCLCDITDHVTLTNPFDGEIHITYMVREGVTFGTASDYTATQSDADHFVPDTKEILTAEKTVNQEGKSVLTWVEAIKITPSPVGHGKITTFPRLGGLEKEPVTLIITSDAGYKFKAGSLVGTYTDPVTQKTEEVEFTSLGNNTYTFPMPGAPVKLTATFVSTKKSSSSQGSSIWLTETPTPEPTLTPTAEPTPVPTQEAPTVKPITTQPTETPKTPVPLMGLLAGLGAAAVVFGLRRQ